MVCSDVHADHEAQVVQVGSRCVHISSLVRVTCNIHQVSSKVVSGASITQAHDKVVDQLLTSTQQSGVCTVDIPCVTTI